MRSRYDGTVDLIVRIINYEENRQQEAEDENESRTFDHVSLEDQRSMEHPDP